MSSFVHSFEFAVMLDVNFLNTVQQLKLLTLLALFVSSPLAVINAFRSAFPLA